MLVDPTVLVSHVDSTSDASAALLQQVTRMDLDPESPLSSHPDGASDVDTVLRHDVTLQTDTALVAELDALDAERRSCTYFKFVHINTLTLLSNQHVPSRSHCLVLHPQPVVLAVPQTGLLFL